MTPDFDELVEHDVEPAERAALKRAHELLVAAGPAPELPPALAAAPEPELDAVPSRRTPPRRLRLALPLAAALAAVAAFAGGFVVGGREEQAFETDFELAMSGTAAAPDASAMLRVGELDEAGNWPMELTVEGLPAGRYELLLTRGGGGPTASCGYFVVDEGETTVFLNAPYRLRDFDGWIVTHARSHEIVLSDA